MSTSDGVPSDSGAGFTKTELDATHAVAESAVNSESLFSAGLSHDELVGVK